MPGVRFPRGLLAVVAALASMLALAATAAAESTGEKIVEKCGHHEPLGGYTQHQYEEALKDMATATSEYSTCESEIRSAELAAAGSGTGGAAGSNGGAALPLTPTERRAVQSAHKRSSLPVRVGGEPIRPGIVKANIASAVNSLPHSLFALLALLAAAALVTVGWEVRKRVRARGEG